MFVLCDGPVGATDLWFDPDGRSLAAVNLDKVPTAAADRWRLISHTASTAGTFDPGIGRLTAVACRPDGLLWAAAGTKGRVAVWDADG